jgi:hypothetical protein
LEYTVLNEKYPEDTFISVEATAYFPEDTGKVHILIYDITVEKFNEIQILRKDILNHLKLLHTGNKTQKSD